MHEIECRVDPFKRHRVGDQIVDVDLAVHVPIDDLGHVGAAACAAKARAAPYPPGHELKKVVS